MAIILLFVSNVRNITYFHIILPLIEKRSCDIGHVVFFPTKKLMVHANNQIVTHLSNLVLRNFPPNVGV